MATQQKVLRGTMVGGGILVLLGLVTGLVPLALVGGVGMGLSLRKRTFIKKKKKKKQQPPPQQLLQQEPGQQKKSKFSFFKRKKQLKEQPQSKQQPLINPNPPTDLYSGKIDGTNVFYPSY